MRIQLRKLSDPRHRLEITRADGSHDSVELDSKSFVVHDFLHYAIETEAGLKQSFWGQLAAGTTFAELAQIAEDRPVEMMVHMLDTEDAVTEAVVGVMTGAIQNNTSPEAIIAGLQNLFEAEGRGVPSWLTPAFIERILEHMRRLLGQWRSIHYGKNMELVFDY
jgi:hypothetical protein